MKEIKISQEFKTQTTRLYFGIDTYEENNLQMLFSAVNSYAFLLSRGYFLTKQKLLNYQVELINTTPKLVNA